MNGEEAAPEATGWWARAKARWSYSEAADETVVALVTGGLPLVGARVATWTRGTLCVGRVFKIELWLRCSA